MKKERHSDKKQLLKICAMVAMVSVIVIVFVVGDRQMSVHDTDKKTQSTSSVSKDNDASNDESVSPTSIYKIYEGDDFYLQLNKDNTYIFLSKDNESYFSGDFLQIRGSNVYDSVSKLELLSYGLNYKKINPNNLFYVKAFYDSHVYGSENEQFYDDVHNPDKEYFEFLIYFRENKNEQEKSVIVAVKHINNDDSFQINKGYF